MVKNRLRQQKSFESMKNQKENSIDGQSAKTRLLEEATALFAEKGYAGTHVREIVARAGVSKPVLYYYFESKEGIFYSILDSAVCQQKAVLAEVIEKPGTALERMIHLYRRIYEGVKQYENLFKMIHNLVFGPPQGAPGYDVERFHRRMIDAIVAIYNEGMARGEVKEMDPYEAAILLLSLLDFCFHLYYIRPDSSDPEKPERLLRLAFQGLEKGSIHNSEVQIEYEQF